MWDCNECIDLERLSNTAVGVTWGHLKAFSCDECKEKCRNEEQGDGIQCTKNLQDTPFPKNRPSAAREYTGGAFLDSLISDQEPARTGVPCVWLNMYTFNQTSRSIMLSCSTVSVESHIIE